MSIVMRRGDGVRQWVPLTQLVPKTCQNLSRSDNKGESFKVGGCPLPLMSYPKPRI